VNTTNNGFINASLHINGSVEANAGGHGGAPYPGHVAAAISKGSPFIFCKGCHSATNRLYPNGTAPNYSAPDCQGCHVKAAPTGVAANCHSCHGITGATALNIGRPVGSVFPDRQRQHDVHGAFACVLCHTGGGSGTATHGNSNHVVKTAANVHIQSSGEATAITFTQNGATVSCTGTCHGETHPTNNPRTW
jgi:hypothetical protein